MRFVIFGGGCYGSFYTRQLLRAADSGAIPQPEIIAVDHNPSPKVNEFAHDARVTIVRMEWDDFMDEYMRSVDVDGDDQFVPPPFTPHLALAWLLRSLGSEWKIAPFEHLPVLPFVNHSAAGTLTASHADWICPTHCIEPATCPHTAGPRHWDMARDVERLGERLKVDQVHVFQCLHMTHGVGTYPTSTLKRAYNALSCASAPPIHRSLVATVSRCHGAMHLLIRTLGTDTVSRQAAAISSPGTSPETK